MKCQQSFRIPARLITLSAATTVAAMVATPAVADIVYGGYTFDNNAFADRAVDNDGGFLFFNDATNLNEALTGYTPDSGLYNIGAGPNSNDFTLYFDDIAAVDNAGADIVLFDLRYSADSYEIAVITGGIESSYIVFDYASQINTGESQNSGSATAWAIEIDLAAYGVASAEAIRFRAGTSDSSSGNPQADPTMAAVLTVPAPGTLALIGVGTLSRLGRRRRSI